MNLENKNEYKLIVPEVEPQPIFDWNDYLEKQKEIFTGKIKDSHSRIEKRLNPKELTFIREIGTGAFGKVYMAKITRTNEHFAVKIIDKLALKKGNNTWSHVMNEKKLLLCIECTFIIKMFSFYENNRKLGFILELMTGGDLTLHLQNMGRFDEPLSRFYSSQILLAIEYLHFMGIVYRDMKPENVLIDSKGYVKLADFGLSKQLTNNTRTYTICGTPDYIAPEIIISKGYGKSVDLWSFGVLLYELNSGTTPFSAKTALAIYTKITSCNYRLPNYFSQDLKDLIKHLLELDLTKRYGLLQGGFNEIKDHRWYQNIAWLGIVNKVIQAPYVPQLKDMPSESTRSTFSL